MEETRTFRSAFRAAFDAELADFKESHPNVLIKYHNDNSGRAGYMDEYDGEVLCMLIPYPESRLRVGLAFHEMSHIRLGHCEDLIEVNKRLQPGIPADDLEWEEYRLEREIEACAGAIELLEKHNLITTETNQFQNRYLDGIRWTIESLKTRFGMRILAEAKQ